MTRLNGEVLASPELFNKLCEVDSLSTVQSSIFTGGSEDDADCSEEIEVSGDTGKMVRKFLWSGNMSGLEEIVRNV